MQAHRRELASLDERLNARLAHFEQRLASAESGAGARGESGRKPPVPALSPQILSRMEELEGRLRHIERAGNGRRSEASGSAITNEQTSGDVDEVSRRLTALEQRLSRKAIVTEVDTSLLEGRLAQLEQRVEADSARWSGLHGEFEKTVSLLDETEVKAPSAPRIGIDKRRSGSEMELEEVRDDVAEAKKYFEHALSSIREDIQQLEENIEHRVHADATRDLSIPLETAVKDRDRYHVKPSVWDAALFFGFQAFDKWTHSLLAIAFMFNLLIQSLLCAIVCFAIADDSYSPGIVDELAVWRSIANATEVAKMCDDDMSLSRYDLQRELYDEAQGYVEVLHLGKGKIAIGPVLSAIVILMWTLNVSSVIRDVVDFVKSINNLRKASNKFSVRYPSQGVFRLQGVNKARFIYAVVAGFLQVLIALLLLVGGSLWLVYTKSIKDLMLNAVALDYVMEFDELLYNVIIPRKVKALIGGMEPLPLSRPHDQRLFEGVRRKCLCCPRHWPKKAIYTFAFSMVVETFFIVVFIAPNYDKVWRVRETICPTLEV